MTIRKQVSFLAVLLLSGCMTLAGQPMASSPCSFEQVWAASSAVLGDVQLQTADKQAGLLETKWLEIESTTRAGALEREINKERVRYVVAVRPDGRGTAATVLQFREEWSPMGVRSRQWRAIPGSSSEESAVAVEISRRLKDKGC